MPYIVFNTSCPNDKIPQAVETFFECRKKFPVDENIVTEVLPTITKATLNGISSLSVQEVKEGKLEEALKRASSYMAAFMRIPGYRYSIETYYSVDEALANIGMAPPK